MFINKENVMRSLQGWVFIVGLMALGNTLSCFVEPSFLSNRLYTGTPEKANDLAARLFGVWTLLSACLRIVCAFQIDNRSIFNMTFVSFILAFGHFASEAFFYKTAPLTIGVLTPMVISGVSLLWMLIAYYLTSAAKEREEKGKDMFPRRVEDIPLLRGRNKKMN